MNCYLKAIVLLGKDKTKRVVPLQPGVNIITGDSKTGKSALVEIIDYCLCASHCSVPKGIITDYTSIYALLLHIDNDTFCIGRQNPSDGGKMYYSEVGDSFTGEQMSYEYFASMVPSPVKEVQQKIESALGMTITNLKGLEEQNKKPSLRSMVSYMFQHQNLIASKFALFYRFTDFAKRKDAIEQFPIFAGLVDQQYYSDLIRLESLKSSLRTKKLALNRMNKRVDYVRQHLLPLIENYYALLGIKLPEVKTTPQIVTLAKNLPEFDDNSLFQDDSIVQRYHSLNLLLEQKRDQRRQVLDSIETLRANGQYGDKYDHALQQMQEQVQFAPAQDSVYTCPLCGKEASSLSQIDEHLKSAMQWLEQELTLTTKYSQSFAEDVRKLQEQKDSLHSEINSLLGQIRLIERKYIQSHELVTLREKVNYAKSQIRLYLDTIDLKDDNDLEDDIARIEAEIEQIRMRIGGYDVEAKLRRAESFLNESMNRIAAKLDLEEEYRPIDLNFALVDETFDLYHHHNGRDKIYLFEMGSGANWLSCHLALFLSFLHYFAAQKKSPMPLFQFYDQPSQVYFPQGLTDKEGKQEDHSSDLEAVNRIYSTLFEEVDLIQRETGIIPQLIVVDHVSDEFLDQKERFDAALRCEWRNGAKLI